MQNLAPGAVCGKRFGLHSTRFPELQASGGIVFIASFHLYLNTMGFSSSDTLLNFSKFVVSFEI
jgi:hypothetical protein